MKHQHYFLSTLFILVGLYSCEEVLFEQDLSEDNVLILAPSQNAIISDSIVNFSWDAVKGAIEYQIQIATPNFTSSTQLVLDSITPALQLSFQLDDNDYQWRLRALNGSSQTIYTTLDFSISTEVLEEDISEEIVTLLAPSDASVLDIRELTFTWEAIEFAEMYELQIATPDFDNPTQVVVNNTLSETSSTHMLENGNYQWRVKAKNTSSQTAYSTNSFEVVALVFNEDISSETVSVIAPPEGTTLGISEINFTWEELEFAEDYQLQIATPDFTNPTQVIVSEILAETTSMQTLENGPYQWRIKARNSSSQTTNTTVSFSVVVNDDTDLSNQSIMSIAPSNASVLDFNNVNFTWQGVTNADDYFIEIATPSFTNPIQTTQNTIAETSYMTALIDGIYEWRVKARNATSQTAFSEVNSFTVETSSNFSNRIVFILSPPNNFISNLSDLNIQWQEVEDATLYRIQVVDPLTNAILDDQTTDLTNIPFTFPEGDLIWQVRAETTSESTQYTSQNITVDTQAPNVPTLLTPMNTEVVTSTSVTFTWDRTPVVGTAEQDMLYVYDDAGLTNLILQENVSGGSFTTTLPNNITYYWNMDASDAAGNVSSDSAVFSFTINE